MRLVGFYGIMFVLVPEGYDTVQSGTLSQEHTAALPYFFKKPTKRTNYNKIKQVTKTLHTSCHLLRVSATRCHHEGVHQPESSVRSTSITGSVPP